MPGSQKKTPKKPKEKRDGGKDGWQRERETQWGRRGRESEPHNTDEMRTLKVTGTLWKTTETWLGIKGCFGALLSELPPCCPVCPSDPLPFLLALSPSLWFLSFTPPNPFSHPAPKHLSYLAFFPSAQVSTCQISPSFSSRFCFFSSSLSI